MISPQPALSSTPAGNVLVVCLEPQDGTRPSADPHQAANDGVLAATAELSTAPAAHLGPAPPIRVSLAIVLAAVLWVLGTVVLLTLALADRLLA